MQSARWIASIKWYLKVASAIFKQDSANSATLQQAKLQQTKVQQAKSLQPAMWHGVAYLWLGILTCVLLFLCWLWICLRIPTQRPPSTHVTINSAINSRPLNKKVANDNPMPTRLLDNLDDPSTERLNKVISQKPPSANDTQPMQKQWGLLSINKAEQAQTILEMRHITDINDDCGDVTICSMSISNDVVIDAE